MNNYNFKPFEKVLVRDDDEEVWSCNYFSHINELSTEYKYVTVAGSYNQCIPYEDNKSLLNTTGKQKRWRAYINEEYWYISSEGIVKHCVELHDKVDDNRYNYGNYFQTAEEAEKIQNRIFDLNHE